MQMNCHIVNKKDIQGNDLFFRIIIKESKRRFLKTYVSFSYIFVKCIIFLITFFKPFEKRKEEKNTTFLCDCSA